MFKHHSESHHTTYQYHLFKQIKLISIAEIYNTCELRKYAHLISNTSDGISVGYITWLIISPLWCNCTFHFQWINVANNQIREWVCTSLQQTLWINLFWCFISQIWIGTIRQTFCTPNTQFRHLHKLGMKLHFFDCLTT